MTTEQEALNIADALDCGNYTNCAAMLRKLVAENESLKHDVETLKQGIEYVERRSDSADKQYLELVAEREADRAAMRRADRALMVAKGTLVELSPCAADDCKQDQTDLMRLAEKTIAEARTDLRQRLEGTT